MLFELWPSDNHYCLYLFSLVLQICQALPVRQKSSDLTTYHTARCWDTPNFCSSWMLL